MSKVLSRLLFVFIIAFMATPALAEAAMNVEASAESSTVVLSTAEVLADDAHHAPPSWTVIPFVLLLL